MEKTYLKAFRPFLWLLSTVGLFAVVNGLLAPALVSSADDGLVIAGFFVIAFGYFTIGWFALKTILSFKTAFSTSN